MKRLILLLIPVLFVTGCLFAGSSDDVQTLFAQFIGDLKVELKGLNIFIRQEFQKHVDDGIAVAIRVKNTESIVFQKTFDQRVSSGELVELIPFVLDEGVEHQISVIVGGIHTAWKDIR